MLRKSDTERPFTSPLNDEKRPGTFRVFVQGGSTAEGYPYGYGASPAGMLQQRLQRRPFAAQCVLGLAPFTDLATRADVLSGRRFDDATGLARAYLYEATRLRS